VLSKQRLDGEGHAVQTEALEFGETCGGAGD